MRVPRRCTVKTLNGSARGGRSRDDDGPHGNAGCPVHVAMAAQGACAATRTADLPIATLQGEPHALTFLRPRPDRHTYHLPTYLHLTAREIVLLMQFTTLFSIDILWLYKMACTVLVVIINSWQMKPILDNILDITETNLKYIIMVFVVHRLQWTVLHLTAKDVSKFLFRLTFKCHAARGSLLIRWGS